MLNFIENNLGKKVVWLEDIRLLEGSGLYFVKFALSAKAIIQKTVDFMGYYISLNKDIKFLLFCLWDLKQCLYAENAIAFNSLWNYHKV